MKSARYQVFASVLVLALVGTSSAALAADPAKKQKVCRVAMAQIYCIDGDREGNLRRIENAVAEASAAGAEIVCLPETCLYGWVNPKAHELAHPIPGKDSGALAKIARQYKVHLSVGVSEKEGDQLFDSVVLFDDEGELILKHRKMNVLTDLMSPPYMRGENVEVVETTFGRVGMLICADTFHDKVVEQMAAKQPELLLVPYGWAAPADAWPGHGQSLRGTIAKAAKTIGCPVVGTNLVGSISGGPWQGMVYGGQSYTVAPDGTVLSQGADRDRDICVVDVPVGE
ncbi:carbon-nitrogen hydrolase family protein [Rhodopirellula sp. P2]|uniref:carbon-nitrogen hydrolase family protein n=1 Tax=Rhodopirellula sp. P2 TaxID=2127060 RepID=UPI00236778BC|nr:carbon-nitrogen hydrolase family protein [Rhodopirellula sp. P2]WDQ15893.1 carbon-nitrogen hydrolase family protein [Rhodopirellula sp. P2]